MKLTKHFIEWLCITIGTTTLILFTITAAMAFTKLSLWPFTWPLTAEAGRMLISLILLWTGVATGVYQGVRGDLIMFKEEQ